MRKPATTSTSVASSRSRIGVPAERLQGYLEFDLKAVSCVVLVAAQGLRGASAICFRFGDAGLAGSRWSRCGGTRQNYLHPRTTMPGLVLRRFPGGSCGVLKHRTPRSGPKLGRCTVAILVAFQHLQTEPRRIACFVHRAGHKRLHGDPAQAPCRVSFHLLLLQALLRCCNLRTQKSAWKLNAVQSANCAQL